MDSDEDDVVESDNRSYTEDSNVKLIKEFVESSESSIDDDLSEEESTVHVKTDKRSAQELATINAHIQKLVRHMKVCGHFVERVFLIELQYYDYCFSDW